jgi:hypothetical protein
MAHQAIEDVKMPVRHRDWLAITDDAARKRIQLETVEREAGKGRHGRILSSVALQCCANPDGLRRRSGRA